MTRTSPNSRSEAGYSLLEMLTVISILTTLFSLLLPAVARTREAAKRTVCMNNLRQIGMGFGTYQVDFLTLPQRPDQTASPAVTSLAVSDAGSEQTRVGLGMLYPDYISDAAIFCCPSGSPLTKSEMRACMNTAAGDLLASAGSASWWPDLLVRTAAAEDDDDDGGGKGKGKGGGDDDDDDDDDDGGGTVTLCHIPPGNPSKAQTMQVGPSAAAAHLAHGDYLGECDCGDDASTQGRIVGAYMFRGFTAMEGFDSPITGDSKEDIKKGLVTDDNTGDMLRVLGVSVPAGAGFYAHNREGVSVLFGDASVRWLPDPLLQCYVPVSGLNDPAQYGRIWQWVDDQY